MTREEIERIGVGDQDAMKKLAGTIKPATPQTLGPILAQFAKRPSTAGTALVPDPTNRGANISSRQRGEILPVPERFTSRPQMYPSAEREPFSVTHERIFDEHPYAVEGDFDDAHAQMAVYNEQCQARFRATVQALYPTLPALWNLPAPHQGEAPPHWGLSDSLVRDVEGKLKAALRRIANDTGRDPRVRKSANEMALGLDVGNARFRTALKQHAANLAVREAVSQNPNDISTHVEALKAILADKNVPAHVRAGAAQELKSLGVA